MEGLHLQDIWTDDQTGWFLYTTTSLAFGGQNYTANFRKTDLL